MFEEPDEFSRAGSEGANKPDCIRLVSSWKGCSVSVMFFLLTCVSFLLWRVFLLLWLSPLVR